MVAKRVIGAVFFVLIFLGSLALGSLPFTLAITFAAAVGAIELFRIFGAKGETDPLAVIVGVAGSSAYVLLAHFVGIESFGYVTAAILFFSLVWYLVISGQARPTRGAAMTMIAPLFSGFCLSHLVLMRSLSFEPRKWSWLVVFFFIVIVWIYDSMAWAVGRKIGSHKMAPVISPQKSWEGTLAGTVGAFATSVILWLIIHACFGPGDFEWLTIWVSLAVAAIVCVLGPLGDLAESMIKRDFGVKDAGNIIPGHGGIMDRLDSTLFSAPAVFYYLYYFVIPR
ncbi:MAG: phosphatidate cytidylyltransferase [Actinomycetota bacterium]|nr:phosphatidate cytidylyltransferase [Actinomycetota bacterium]